MLVMPAVVPAGCYSWEFGQGIGKRLLPKKEITEEGFWAKPLLSLVRAGIWRCKDKVFKKKSPVFENRILGIKQLILLHNQHVCCGSVASFAAF